MTEHDDKQVARVDTVANAGPSKGRRRLVKGAMLATPAVMTLMSGRLMAATSLTCNDKLPQTPTRGDSIAWVDSRGLPLQWGVDDSGVDALGYYDLYGQFQAVDYQTAMNVTSNSCWASFN